MPICRINPANTKTSQTQSIDAWLGWEQRPRQKGLWVAAGRTAGEGMGRQTTPVGGHLMQSQKSKKKKIKSFMESTDSSGGRDSAY